MARLSHDVDDFLAQAKMWPSLPITGLILVKPAGLDHMTNPRVPPIKRPLDEVVRNRPIATQQ